MSLAGQFAFHGDDGERYLWAAVGLDRQRWLSVMLTMVRIRAHARVLEVSTDPSLGHSATILADATDGGSVISIDEIPQITRRAHQAQRYRDRAGQLTFHTGRFRDGWPDGAPYDLIVSLIPFGWLPDAWLHQCRPGAAIVTPLEVDRPGLTAFLKVDVDNHHQPINPQALHEIDSDPRHPRYQPTDDVALHHDPDEPGYDIGVWLSP